MPGLNSRAKGKRFEREVAKLLTKYWSHFEDNIQFVSTPLSGGFSNAKMRGDMKISGDLMTNSEIIPWCFECKHREKWNLENLLEGKRSPIWSWWEQCIKAAKEENKIPMLWFRKNRGELWILVPESSTTAYDNKHQVIKQGKFLKPEVVEYFPVLIRAKDFLENVK